MRRVLLPLAHAGEDHWYDTIMFVTPMVVTISVLLVVVWRDRRAGGWDDEDDLDEAGVVGALSDEAGWGPVDGAGEPRRP